MVGYSIKWEFPQTVACCVGVSSSGMLICSCSESARQRERERVTFHIPPSKEPLFLWQPPTGSLKQAPLCQKICQHSRLQRLRRPVYSMATEGSIF